MKMAKASISDIEMALELSRFIEDLEQGICPTQAQEDPEDEFNEWLEDDLDQLKRVIEALTKIVRKGSIFRVTFGMGVLLDPRNELLDPDADTLEPHPKFAQLAKDAERYHWFADVATTGAFDRAEAAFACFEDAEACTKAELDQAIDTAIAAQKGEQV